MVTTPDTTLSGSSRPSSSRGVLGNDVFGRPRSFASVSVADSMFGSTSGSPIDNVRILWTGEYCGTTVVETIASTQVTARKPHALPGVSPGVLT